MLFSCEENMGKTTERKRKDKIPVFQQHRRHRQFKENYRFSRTTMNPAGSSRAVFIIVSHLGTLFI